MARFTSVQSRYLGFWAKNLLLERFISLLSIPYFLKKKVSKKAFENF